MRRFALQVAVLFMMVLSISLSGCNSIAPELDSLSVSLKKDAQGFYYHFSNGQETRSPMEASAIIKRMKEKGVAVTKLTFDFKTETSGENGTLKNPLTVGIPFTNAYLTVKWFHTHYVGGCIRRVVPHINVLVNRQGGYVYGDLHVAGWHEGGRLCIGVYISPQGWCRVSCSPTYNEIRRFVQSALAVVIGGTAAYYASYILAPLVIAPALAL